MKKFDIAASLGIIILCVLLMIMVGLRSIDGDAGGTAPSYRFLGGRNPIKCEKAKTGNEDRRYTYSFEADFNDLCSKAYSELRPAGFTAKGSVKILSSKESMEKYYYLKGRFPRGPVWIYIYDNRQCIKFPNSEHSAFCEKDGWVMVEVVYGRGWQWPF